MKLLILGGNGFLGQVLIQSAIKKDYDVTYLSRHSGNGPIFSHPKVTYLKGDIFHALSCDKEQTYDCVIDCVGTIHPKYLQSLNVDATKEAIILSQKLSIKHFVYISANSGFSSYLRSKEKASSYLIVKPGLLFGPKRPMSLLLMFFFKMILLLPIYPSVSDEIYPLDVRKVAEVIIAHLEKSYGEKTILSLNDLKGTILAIQK
ncbi:NAD-dependent epimerase/dehydratase family protein [Streptococcus uberis]|uniref:NAD-dependent epimerase/dehydratase family protein n=1 Tax=Streptococcus uberis TaxID=1349 RepID=UPI001FF6731C|nr:NAD(P)-dependent oxidoreductase [Streptococcus uberis]MCK1214785.1 NAD(P)-dependent oxidoreductase [Streptococcus uberis]